jgi:hypothetical protein
MPFIVSVELAMMMIFPVGVTLAMSAISQRRCRRAQDRDRHYAHKQFPFHPDLLSDKAPLLYPLSHFTERRPSGRRPNSKCFDAAMDRPAACFL